MPHICCIVIIIMPVPAGIKEYTAQTHPVPLLSPQPSETSSESTLLDGLVFHCLCGLLGNVTGLLDPASPHRLNLDVAPEHLAL